MQDHSNRISPSGKIRYIPVDRGYETPCWEWQMGRDRVGYGRLRLNGKHMAAHRYLYELKYGKVSRKKQMDHLCRNRSCVNPDHLQVVTPAQNTRLGNATPFTHEQIAEIRKLKGKMTTAEVGRMYGVARQTIGRIWNGKRWAGSGQDVVVIPLNSAKHTISRDIGVSENDQNPRHSKGSGKSVCRVQDSAGCARTDK